MYDNGGPDNRASITPLDGTDGMYDFKRGSSSSGSFDGGTDPPGVGQNSAVEDRWRFGIDFAPCALGAAEVFPV